MVSVYNSLNVLGFKLSRKILRELIAQNRYQTLYRSNENVYAKSHLRILLQVETHKHFQWSALIIRRKLFDVIDVHKNLGINKKRKSKSNTLQTNRIRFILNHSSKFSWQVRTNNHFEWSSLIIRDKVFYINDIQKHLVDNQMTQCSTEERNRIHRISQLSFF